MLKKSDELCGDCGGIIIDDGANAWRAAATGGKAAGADVGIEKKSNAFDAAAGCGDCCGIPSDIVWRADADPGAGNAFEPKKSTCEEREGDGNAGALTLNSPNVSSKEDGDGVADGSRLVLGTTTEGGDARATEAEGPNMRRSRLGTPSSGALLQYSSMLVKNAGGGESSSKSNGPLCSNAPTSSHTL